MKANELRIGNIVIRQGKLLIVEGCDINWFENGSYIGFEPIPLTEEWLVKLGFHKSTKFNGSFVIGHNDCNYHVQLRDWSEDVGIFIEYTDSSYEQDDGVLYPIAFIKAEVHMIQNFFYYVRNGEELTIKT